MLLAETAQNSGGAFTAMRLRFYLCRVVEVERVGMRMTHLQAYGVAAVSPEQIFNFARHHVAATKRFATAVTE